MTPHETDYYGCPVQYARQFIAGKWQMGILWNLKDKPLRFSEIKKLLPGLPDKSLNAELEFFIEKNIVHKSSIAANAAKSEYSLTVAGVSLIPVITLIIQWGFVSMQDQKMSKNMNYTPGATINTIRNTITFTTEEI